MIDIRNLQKSYGDTQALKGIGFSIRSGEVVGLLGPNGAGKTTAMKILVGFLLPSGGEARVAGIDVTADPLEVQRRIGYLPENAPSYHEMLVQELLLFMAEMHGMDAAARKRNLERTVDECGIYDVLTRPIGHLSKGYRQRVGLAAAILHDPEILILDEPTTGLDPNQIVEARELIRRMGRTKTVILSTHILPEVEATCGRAVILIDGRVRADGSLDDLTRSRTQVVTVRPDDPAGAKALLEAVDHVEHVETVDAGDGFHTYRLGLDGDHEVGERVAEIVRERRWPMRELRRDDKSLEQVFRELTETAGEVAA
jgi:ABC-2 type transport system ATP-binding protein